MEKKGNRNTSNSSRGSSGTDLKKSQDATTGKAWPRGATRRREPPCGFSKTNEPSRKPQPQRNSKASDKRPKPRGFYYSGAVPRNEEASLEDLEEPELGSVFTPGSKKQSLNHLLNFSFAPRGNYQHGRSATDKKGGKLLATKKHKYNKEHFLQANCQFIVNEKGDYKQYLNNPDALVDWDLIEQVNVQVNEKPSCPICLYPPVAAKMSRCGHIYCWSCLLHYLSLSDKPWRKCPICFDAIRKEDLKSVIVIPHKTFNIKDTITFKLMKRQRGSLVAYPADTKVLSNDNVFNMSDQCIENCYSKLLLASKQDILDMIDREETELKVQMAEDQDCPEICFMEAAVQLLNIRRDNVLEKDQDKEVNVTENKYQNDADIPVNPQSNESEACVDVADNEQSPKLYYFYQAADGQHIYLHALNAKMLEHTYGSLECGPKTLTGQILEKEGGSMTEELRKRLRYLQHLPVTCQFEVAEIRLHQPVVTKDTLDFFKEQIDIRKKRRNKRAREEVKRSLQFNIEENRQFGKYEAPELHLDSRSQFPDVQEAHFMFPEFISAARPRTESEATHTSERSASPEPSPLDSSVTSMSLESYHSGPSFASMLSSEKKSSWPSIKSSRTFSNAAKQFNDVGSKLSPAVNPSSKHLDRNQGLEDYEPVPDFNRSFGAALAEALASVSVEDNEEHNDSRQSGKKKRKKTKQKVLFSTHMAFQGH